MSRWVAMHCGHESDDLQELHPNAFLLLCQIARRARWKDSSINGLKYGQALIGDWKNAGLKSEKAYRHAKLILTKFSYAAFKGTGKGTVATLMEQPIFSLSMDSGAGNGADGGRTKGRRGATNHTEHPEYSETTNRVTYSASSENGQSPLSSDAASLSRISEEDAPIIALELLKAEDPSSDLVLISPDRIKQWAIDWFIMAEQSGWIMKDGQPIRNARLALRGYLRKAASGNLDRFEEMRESRPCLKPLSHDDNEDEPF